MVAETERQLRTTLNIATKMMKMMMTSSLLSCIRSLASSFSHSISGNTARLIGLCLHLHRQALTNYLEIRETDGGDYGSTLEPVLFHIPCCCWQGSRVGWNWWWAAITRMKGIMNQLIINFLTVYVRSCSQHIGISKEKHTAPDRNRMPEDKIALRKQACDSRITTNSGSLGIVGDCARVGRSSHSYCY